MSIIVYDLAGKDDRRFSPFCWRTRMALAHKGLEAEFRPWRFTDKEAIAFSGQGRTPVMVDGDMAVCDSWVIACDLEDRYPDRPSLFGGARGRALARFLNHFVDQVGHPRLARVIILDVFEHLDPADCAYFRRTREERFGATLEAVQSGRDQHVLAWRAALEPVRAQLGERPFMAGDDPAYADYILFGMFQWARAVSAYPLLEKGDPIARWRARMMGLFGGLPARLPGYAIAA